jgi:diacylglycerol kinase
MTLNSFKYAIKGIIKEMTSGASFKVMLIFLAAVVAAGLIFWITITEWIILLLCCSIVLTAEMINTSIETVVDMVCKNHDPMAEKAKDIAAGAVLVFSIFAAAIGALIFIPYIIALFK